MLTDDGRYDIRQEAPARIEEGALRHNTDPVLADLLAQTAAPAAACVDLVARMSAVDRHYHGLDHLTTLWARHRRYGPAAGFGAPSTCRLVASAIAFHDSVYVPGAPDNEVRSAALWCAAASPDMPAAEVDWVAETIVCTANHLAADDVACQEQPAGLRLWILDLDLTPLGEVPAIFAANQAMLQREGAAGDQAATLAAEAAFLGGIAQASQIYRSPILAAQFERQARHNIAQALARLA